MVSCVVKFYTLLASWAELYICAPTCTFREGPGLNCLTIYDHFSGLFTAIRPYTVQFSEIENRRSYGPVRCDFKKAEILRCGSVLWYILRCGSVRLWKIRHLTVWFGAVIYPSVRFGAILKNKDVLRCGSVRFSDIVNHTARFGAVIYLTVRFGAVPRWTFFSSMRLHCPLGKPYNTVFPPRCTVWINRTKRRFRTVLALFLGAGTKPVFSTVSIRCTAQIKRTNPRMCTVSCRYFTSRQSHQQQQVLSTFKNRFNKSICTYIYHQ